MMMMSEQTSHSSTRYTIEMAQKVLYDLLASLRILLIIDKYLSCFLRSETAS